MAPHSWTRALPLFLGIVASGSALAQPNKRDIAPAAPAPSFANFPDVNILPPVAPSAATTILRAPTPLPQPQSALPPASSTPGPLATGGLAGGAPPMGNATPSGGPQKPPGAPAGAHGAPGDKPKGPLLYEPSFSIAAAMAMVFFVSFVATTKQFFKYKTWFLFLLPQAVLMHVIGCVARVHFILHPKAMTAYILQHLMFSIPAGLMGVLVMINFTRVVWLVTPNSLRNRKNVGVPIHHISFLWGLGWLTADITKAVATNLGKPKGHGPPKTDTLANRVQQICMLIMLVIIGSWTLWATLFMRKSRHWPPPTDGVIPGVRSMGWATVAMGVLMTGRTLFSTIEHDVQYNPKGFASTHEWVFWVGGVFPILAVYTIFNLWHPGTICPPEYTRFKFDTKRIERRLVEEGSWPPSISNPMPRDQSPQDPKGFEVAMHEMQPHPGHKV